MGFASTDDLEARWRPLSEAEQTTAQTLLDDASLYLSRWYPGIADGAIQDEDVETALIIVTCNMVKRALMSDTSGVTQEMSTTGPYSHMLTFSNPEGNLYVTSTEDKLIRGYRPKAVSVRYRC